MFLNFYGLKEQPFGVTPDARYLYLSNTHREALASLFYGIESGRGFMAMIAKPGMGKTTLLAHILKRFQRSARTAFLFNTQCNSREFLEALASELGFECSSTSYVQFLEEFNRNLVREARQRRRCIVVIDEAQNLDGSVLETARLLSNFETPHAKLLQIVLAGQPELADKLASPALRQLRQRVSIFSRLDPFTAEETAGYIYHRLQLAGYAGPAPFTPDGMSAIAEHAEGVPRNINNLCFAALSMGCATKRKTIDAAIVREVVADLDVTRLGSSEYRDGTSRTHTSDGDHQLDSPFGWQSPITFGRFLRKMPVPGMDKSAGPAMPATTEPDTSLPALDNSAALHHREITQNEVQLTEAQVESSEVARVLGGRRPGATILNAMQQPGIGVADAVPSLREPMHQSSYPPVARRIRRRPTEIYLFIAIVALMAASFYHPQGTFAAVSLTQPHPQTQDSRRAEQLRIPGSPPSQHGRPEIRKSRETRKETRALQSGINLKSRNRDE